MGNRATFLYIGTYLLGLLALVTFYTLDYSVNLEKGLLQNRKNFIASNEAKIFMPFQFTAIGKKFYDRYSSNTEKEITFANSQSTPVKFLNIFSKEYPSLTVHDWFKEIGYTAVIKESLITQKVPFHVNNLSRVVISIKDRFLSVPIWPFSPQVLLVLLLSPIAFIFVNHLLLYSIGAFGIAKIAQEYKLCFPAFLFLFLIFNFNGHIIEKFAAYGPGQLGYYFIPFVVLFLLRLGLANSNSTTYSDQKNALYLGASLGLILLQGSLHLFVQVITFLIIWTFFNFSKLKFIVIAFTSAFALNAVRLFPAAVSFGVMANPHVAQGYTDPIIVMKALVYPTTQLTWPPFAWWELSLFISVFGFLLLLKYAVLDPMLNKKLVDSRFNYKMFLPIIIMTALCFWKISNYLIPQFIPLLNSESHPARYAIIPLILFSTIAAFNIHQYIGVASVSKRIVLYLLLALLALFLFEHLLLWRLPRIQAEAYWLFDHVDNFIPGLNIMAERTSNQELRNFTLLINNRNEDYLYIISFYIGLFITIFSAGILMFLSKQPGFNLSHPKAKLFSTP